ncbi:MAG: YtxH domain-containing protein [Candidatus Sericytochromatia bacterium]|uniref:YtxH domain-containing protein n=1 Tax=Candidatus Tanganyikabacteria bacterium TaxID=2961651 RepID=A0A937X4J9_9BACT|nr:YtxH domain-containing protein [Candidatus Tanganyikabacteria bacterium]
MDQRSGTLELLTGLIVGALGGFAVGMLMAPQTGTRTREQLNDQISDLRVRTNEMLEHVRGNTESLLASTRTTIEEKLNLLSDAMEAGKKAAAYKREELIEGEGTAN